MAAKNPSAHVTTTQIAAKAGVSRTTVSFALRNNPKIPAETAARVRAAAEELGYRPNPRITALMSHIRGSHPVTAGERIAFVWVHTPRSETANEPFLQRVFHGARSRAESLGYRLEQFWSAERGMTDRRLSEVLKTRGIVGVLLSPVLHEAEVKLDLEWSSFAPAVIGSARWNPELHHAGHHHYLAMRMALEKLAAAGCRRPLAIIEAEVNERARRAWQAAFLVFHPTPAAAAELVMIGTAHDRRALARRLQLSRPDALVVSSAVIVNELRALGGAPSADIPVVSLHWVSSQPDIGGIDQSYDLIAANAVDLVVSQLNSNETGVPTWPRMLLFPGRWVEPTGRQDAVPAPRARSGTGGPGAKGSRQKHVRGSVG